MAAGVRAMVEVKAGRDGGSGAYCDSSFGYSSWGWWRTLPWVSYTTTNNTLPEGGTLFPTVTFGASSRYCCKICFRTCSQGSEEAVQEGDTARWGRRQMMGMGECHGGVEHLRIAADLYPMGIMFSIAPAAWF